jgi:hypothetical protein
MEGGGHLNRGSGYSTFVELIAAIEAMEQAAREQIPTATDKTQETQHSKLGEHPPEITHTNPTEHVPNEKKVLPGFHGMQLDLARAVGSNQGSIVSDVLAEARQMEAVDAVQNPKSARNLLFGIFGTILILVGVGFLAITAMKLAPRIVPITSIQERYRSIVRVDKTIMVTLPPLNGEESITNALTEIPTRGTITALVPVDQTESRISFTRTLELLGVSTIPALVRGYVAPEYTWGIWGADDGQSAPFLVLRVTSYDGAFGALREWEPRLPQDLGILLGIPKSVITSTQTFTSWTNTFIANRPVRVLQEVFAPAVKAIEQGIPPTEQQTQAENQTQEQSTQFETQALDQIQPLQTPASEIESQTNETVGAVPKENPILYTSFLSEQLLVITPRPDILPELIRRLADQQILE